MSRAPGRSRRQFLKDAGAAAISSGSLAFLSSFGLTGCARKSRRKLNVILVMTDDQGFSDIGAHGSPYVKTPTLDALHAKSVRLTNFHTDPCCSPTRASLLTGQYSARSGVWHTIGGRSLLARDRTTMADLFQSAGYRTGIFGKWHLGEDYPFRPQDRGFQETFVHRGGSVSATIEDPNSRRSLQSDNMDFRIEKEFQIGKIGKFGMFLDIFNLFGNSYPSVGYNPAGTWKPVDNNTSVGVSKSALRGLCGIPRLRRFCGLKNPNSLRTEA